MTGKAHYVEREFQPVMNYSSLDRTLIVLVISSVLLSVASWSATIRSWIDAEHPCLGNPFPYAVEVSWDGQTEGYQMPTANISHTGYFEAKRPSVQRSAAGHRMKANWTWDMIPLKTGQLDVPVVTVSAPWMQPGRTLATAPLAVMVSESAGAGTMSSGALFGGGAIFVAALLWWRKRRKIVSSQTAVDAPGEIARHSLRELTTERLLRGTGKVPEQLSTILGAYLKCRVGRKYNGKAQWVSALKKCGVSTDTAEKGAELMMELDENRFSGIVPDEIKAGALEARTASMIESLEAEMEEVNDR